MAEIPLTRGLVALVDDADLPLIAVRKWCAVPRRGGASGWYAQASFGGKKVLMHKLLRPGLRRIDHRNGNGLDNRDENMRPCTQGQNNANAFKGRRGVSRFKGVWLDARRQHWRAGISVNNRTRHIPGRFASEAEAAAAYNVAALAQWGEYARLNEIPA